MVHEYIVTRDVTKQECPWLNQDVAKGTIVTEFRGCTYGCISYTGMAVTMQNESAFLELPLNALEMRKAISV